MKIDIKRVEKLDQEEERILNMLTKEYDEKINVIIKDIKLMEIDLKSHGPEGENKRYELNIKVKTPKGVLRTNVEDWGLAKTVHKGFKKIINEGKHKFHD